MLDGVFSFLGGVGDFASYITGYFKENGIKDTQKQIDELTKALEYALANNEELIKKCEQEKLLIRTEYDQRIDAISMELDAINPKIGGREISG